VCVCVCVFLLACLLACVLLWATSEEMKLFLLSSNLNNFSSNLLVGRLPCKHKALDQIFLSIWRAPYIHEYFVKRIHEEVTQFVKWIVWCVYSLSMQGILHLLIGIRSYHYEGLGESTLPTPHLPLVLLHLEGTLYSWNSSLILTLKIGPTIGHYTYLLVAGVRGLL
jgi:hypothetical protein